MIFYTKDKGLYKKCFKAPAKKCDKLRFVSGYVRVNLLVEMAKMIEIEALYGMICQEGLSSNDINEIKKMPNVKVYCPTNKKTFHQKLYVWYKEGEPVEAFCGSANFTSHGLIKREQGEILWSVDAKEAHEYLETLFPQCKKLEDLTEEERKDLDSKKHRDNVENKEKKRQNLVAIAPHAQQTAKEEEKIPKFIAEYFAQKECYREESAVACRTIARYIKENHADWYKKKKTINPDKLGQVSAEINSCFNRYFHKNPSNPSVKKIMTKFIRQECGENAKIICIKTRPYKYYYYVKRS